VLLITFPRVSSLQNVETQDSLREPISMQPVLGCSATMVWHSEVLQPLSGVCLSMTGEPWS
jgi:hypothetical protein